MLIEKRTYLLCPDTLHIASTNLQFERLFEIFTDTYER